MLRRLLVATLITCGLAVGSAPASAYTYNFTGAFQTVTVPAGMTVAKVELLGAQGGGSGGGRGARVSTTIAVTPGEVLRLYVGGQSLNALGGYNGGGDAPTTSARGGGGATDIRRAPYGSADRIAVAGGGGGAGGGGTNGGDSGSAGSQGGSPRDGEGGQPGSGSTGGAGGAAGNNEISSPEDGAAGVGPDGGDGGGGNGSPDGGGGGGGLAGGGGGGGGGDSFDSSIPDWIHGVGGGGGGGSSLAAGGSVENGQREGDGHADVTFSTSFDYIEPGANPDPSYVVIVPTGMTVASVDLFGAQGGRSVGGKGARAQGTVAVVPGEELRLYVGGQPAATSQDGGYNGGGSAPGQTAFRGRGGGGSTDIRRAPYTESDRLVVAGGGGGSGSRDAPGGDSDGAGAIGGSNPSDGKGGRPGSEGGTGGAAGTANNGNADPGGNANGRDGGQSGTGYQGYENGGGGGGGLVGGGGGGGGKASGSSGGGGGGGSSLAPAGTVTQGAHTGSGKATVTFSGPASGRPVNFSYLAPGAGSFGANPFFTVTVPAGANRIETEMLGAGAAVGKGAKVTSTTSVTPGEQLRVYVGGKPSGSSGGYNGGGASTNGNGGGGASDIRRGADPAGRFVVAGGAGGGGAGPIPPPGDGGDSDTVGGQGSESKDGKGGGPGSTGGAGGAGGDGNATNGDGAAGNPGTASGIGGASSGNSAAGGGGGGLHGGGAGGYPGTDTSGGNFFGGLAGGGGGGSSLFPGGSVANGVNAGNGQVSITFSTATAPGSGTGTGGGGGGGASTSSTTVRDTVKPTLGAFGLSRTAFAAAPSGASVSAKKKRKAPIGTKVSYRLSEAATVRFTVQLKSAGRRNGKKCGKPTRKNRKKAKCTRWVTAPGSFTHRGTRGSNSFTFRGRVGGKKLKPGSYRLNGTAKDPAGNASKLQQKAFRIVKS